MYKEWLERMKVLRKERNELYEKRNRLKGQKEYIERGFEWQSVKEHARSFSQFLFCQFNEITVMQSIHTYDRSLHTCKRKDHTDSAQNEIFPGNKMH